MNYKDPNKPSYIDLIMTNRSKRCQNSCKFEIGLSDFHKIGPDYIENLIQTT